MTVLEEIRSRYALLTDEELLGLLSERATLRPDAFEVLKEECIKRGIDKNLVAGADGRRPFAEPGNIRGNTTREQKKWWREVTSYAFEQKYNEATDDEILAGLIGMRAGNEEAIYIINKLDEWAGEAIKDAIADRLGGITRAICGMAVIIIIILVPLGNTITILGGLLCIGGLVQVANAEYRRKRYIAIQNNIAAQNSPVNNFGDEQVEYTEIL
jgi:hypothetical protein